MGLEKKQDFFESNGIIFKLIVVMDAPLCEYTKSHYLNYAF